MSSLFHIIYSKKEKQKPLKINIINSVKKYKNIINYNTITKRRSKYQSPCEFLRSVRASDKCPEIVVHPELVEG